MNLEIICVLNENSITFRNETSGEIIDPILILEGLTMKALEVAKEMNEEEIKYRLKPSSPMLRLTVASNGNLEFESDDSLWADAFR